MQGKVGRKHSGLGMCGGSCWVPGCTNSCTWDYNPGSGEYGAGVKRGRKNGIVIVHQVK